MSESCDFTVAVRIVAFDGSTVRVDLNDHASGYYVLRPLLLPGEQMRQSRTSAPRVAGSYRLTSVLDDAVFPVQVSVRGSTWAQVETRWEALREAFALEDDFYIETEIEGVTRRWRTERPNSEQGAMDLKNKRVTFQLSFIVQPNPTVTIV